jgi:Protein of unknown function (DUF3108)
MPVAKCAVVRSRETTTSWPSRDPSLKVASFIVAQLSALPVTPGASASRRWPFFVLAGLAVLALHWGLLVWLAPSWIDPEEPSAPPPTLSVRSVTLHAPAQPAAPAPTLPLARVTQPALEPKVVRAPLVRKPAASAPQAETPPPAAVEVSAAAPEPVPAALVAAPIEPPPAPAIEVPVYATRLPPAGTWRYQLTRGIASGEALLSWSPTEQQRYEMKLEGLVAGISVLDWVSTGAIDNAGIAPDRFVIRRRGKDSQAANFQRDTSKITFSGPTHELPLIAGVQDRLSWMLQLPGVIKAAPQDFGPGQRVVLMVIGARGGADVWTFNVIGTERVGEIVALKLVREARKPRDVQVDVWLDPARGHIPVRALLTQPEGGAPLELQLQTESTGS